MKFRVLWSLETGIEVQMKTLRKLRNVLGLLMLLPIPSVLMSQSANDRETNVDPDDVEILSGVSFAQVDFTFEGAEDDNTTYGVAIVDHAAVEAQLPGSGDWYLNVLVYDPRESVPRWAVQNLPLVNSYVMDGVSTFFSLLPEIERGNATLDGAGAEPPQRGKVMNIDAGVLASRQPKGQMPVVPPRNHVLPPMNLKWNAQGFMVPVNFKMPDLPAKPLCPPEPDGETRAKAILPQNNLKSVQQDVNQCAPASANNSCQYLCDSGTCGDNYTMPNLTNIPGIFGDPMDSRVGRIDFRMGRKKGQATPGYDGLVGKLNFLCKDWGMTDDTLVVRHQGNFCSRDGARCVQGNMNQTISCPGNAGQRKITSTGMGAPSINFIANAITTDKADLELAGPFVNGMSLAGHAVHVVGYAKTKGVDQIWYIHDANQGDNNKGVEYNEGGRGFVCLVPLPRREDSHA